MLDSRYVFGAALLAAMVFSSCQCNDSDPEIETTPVFPERAVDFNVKRAVEPETVARDVAPEEPEVEPEAEPEPAALDPRIPEDFPAEVPVYEGSELAQVQPLANNAHNVVFRTSDSVGQVHGFYNDEMAQKGWQVTQQFERDGHAFTTFKKGDVLMNLTIAEDAQNPGQQVIAIMYEQVQPLPFDEF